MTRVLIVTPAYNEESGLPDFVQAVALLREQLRPATQARTTPPTVKLAPEARELPPAKPQQQSPWPW